MPSILIELKEDQSLCATVSGEISWETALRMLLSTIRHLARKTADTIAQIKHKPVEQEYSAVYKEVAADIADEINFGISNVLEELSPKDPDLALTEKAIAGAENLIIHYAADHHMTIKEALDSVNEIFTGYLEGRDG